MIPIYERLFSKIKKIPVLNKMNKIPVLKKIANSIRKQDIEHRRRLVKKNGYSCLEKIYYVAEKNNIELWIDWGTLLGYYREGKILEHDYDLDVSTWRMKEDAHQLFISEMNNAGFRMVRQFVNGSTIMTETFEMMGVLIDIEYYWREEEKACTYCFDLNPEQTKLIQKKDKQLIEGMNIYVFSTKCIEFEEGQFSNGTKCFIPKETEKRVCEMYSENWKTPIKDYNWKDLHNYTCLGFFENATGWRIK